MLTNARNGEGDGRVDKVKQVKYPRLNESDIQSHQL